MNDLIKREGTTCVTEATKNADIKITLEQWPCLRRSSLQEHQH